ncbi:MAG: helix-turn-helix transcriptional regulator [Clostridia bacterium]|nr:helix-turn-helix transcriptional regulator [Clostridia bacterium]
MAKSTNNLASVKTDWITNEHLKINNCASITYKSAPARTVRPNGRKDYSLFFITNGCCYIDIDSDSPKTVKKGNVIIYAPNIPQDYCFLPKDASTHVYIHFTGTDCESIFRKLNLPQSGVLNFAKNSEIENYLFKLCESFDNSDSRATVYCQGLLLAILSLLAPADSRKRDTNAQYSKAINNIIGQIRSKPSENYSIEKWAKECGFTRPYFIQVFKKTTGMAPHQYLTKTRIKYAKEMLLFTDMPISKIGSICGYTDYNYFSRIFKKTEGVSPVQYRKKK